MSAVPQLVRQRCLTCSRSLLPSDLLAGLCPDCLLARIDSWDGDFGLEVCKAEKRCMECSQSLDGVGGYVHWDVTAKSFYLLCIPCSEKAIQKAGQYRRTPFAFIQKAQ